MRKVTRLRVVGWAWLWVVILLPTTAQPVRPDQPVRHFTVFSPRPISGLTFAPGADRPPQTLVFYPTARSPDYEYRGGMPMKFFAAESGEIVAEAVIPWEIRRALLLVMPANHGLTGQGLRYQVAILDDSALRHGRGGLAIINLSGLVLEGTVNAGRVMLRAGLNPTLSVGNSAKIDLSTRFNNRSYQAYRETVALAAAERALLVLFPPFYPGSLEVQGRMLLDEPPVEPVGK